MSSLFESLIIVNQIRNKYAHGTYAAGKGSESVTLIVYSSDRAREPRAETINLSTLDEDVLFFKRVAMALQDWAMPDRDLVDLAQAASEARPVRELDL